MPDDDHPEAERTVQVTNAGATSVGGNVHLEGGGDVAGRDLIKGVSVDTLVVGADEALLEALARAAAQPQADAPYPGVVPFSKQQAGAFHGRSRDIARLVGLIDEGGGLVTLVGASGSGKSSLLAAGVVPSLTSAERPWRWHDEPLRLGAHPLRNLAELLARLLGDHDARGAPALAERLLAEPAALAELLLQAQSRVGLPLLVVVDQLEEVFAPGVDEAERRTVLTALAGLRPTPGYSRPRLCVVVALRSDFYPRLADVRAFAEAAAARQCYLASLDDDGIRETVQRPAELAGLRVDADLVDRIVDDMRSSGSALPFLAAALLETWRRRQGSRLTSAGYLASGGVEGALEKSADAAWAGLAEELREPSRRLLLRLVDSGAADVHVRQSASPVAPSRRRRPVSDLVTDVDDHRTVTAALQALADARLVTVDVGATPHDVVVEIVHDALLTGWHVMRGWLEADRETTRLQEDLAAGADAWAQKEDPAYLYRGDRLAELSRARAQKRLTVNEVEGRFLDAAERAEAGQRRRSLLLVLLPALLVIALVVATLTWRQQQATAEAKTYSDALHLAAQSRGVGRTDAGLAALLAAAAGATAPDRSTWSALVDALAGHDAPAAFARPCAGATASVAPGAAPGLAFAGCADGAIREVTLPRGTTTRTLGGHSSAVVALDLQGRLLVSGDVQGRVLVHDVRSGRRLAAFETGVAARAVAADPARDAVATVDADGTLHRWTLPRPDGGASDASRQDRVDARDVVALPRGGFVVATSEGALLAAPARPAGPPAELAPARTTTDDSDPALAARPDGSVVARAPDGLVVVPSSPDPVPRPVAAPPGDTLAVTPRGDTVVVGTKSGSLRRWTIGPAGAAGGDVFQGNPSPVVGVVTSGSWAAALTASGGVAVWDLERAAAPAAVDLALSGDRPVAVAHNAQGRLAAGFTSGRLAVLDDATAVRTSVQLDADAGSARAVVWRGDTVVAGTDAGALLAWRPGEDAPTPVLDRGAGVTAMGADRNGTLAVGRQDGSVQLVSPGGEIRAIRPAGGSAVTALALSPDGTRLAVGTGDGPATELVLWRLTPDPVDRVTLPGATLFVSSITFTPDGGTLVAGSDDRAVRFYATATGSLLGEGLVHTDTVRAASVSPDGATLATAGDDGTVVLWDLAERRPVGAPLEQGPSGQAVPVLGVAASPDGRSLVVAAAALRVWPLAMDAWREQACAYAGRDLTADERSTYSPGDALPPLCP